MGYTKIKQKELKTTHHSIMKKKQSPHTSSEKKKVSVTDASCFGALGSTNDSEGFYHLVQDLILQQTKFNITLDIIESVLAKTMIKHVKNITHCNVLENKSEKTLKIKTFGVNFKSVWEITDFIDIDNIYSNDVGALLKIYGVEAARVVLINEIYLVFRAYNIKINYRHLGLIADHLTNQGGYQPCNRQGIEFSNSPILKMSFETATNFLTDAAIKGISDELKTPSSCIAVGKLSTIGTGSCDILYNLL